MRVAFVVLVALVVVGCGSSPCSTVCKKLASCNAITSSEKQCEDDCEHPASGRTCLNEDAIATCFQNATCDELTSQSSRLQCPTCQ
ncbi:MAG: hypothetical protein JST54_03405 [Deltaproteobacteria bacterium]|nr:hypothetical protein [Deltaproteobacteria bacterium]